MTQCMLVTGASGSVGPLLRHLQLRVGYKLVAPWRHPCPGAQLNVSMPSVGEIERHPDWRTHLRGVDVVVHAGTRVHAKRFMNFTSQQMGERIAMSTVP